MMEKLKNLKAKLGKWFWVIVILLVLGIGGYFFFSKQSENGTVTTAVQKGKVMEELILTGSVKADKHAVLTFPTGGKIIGVYVKEGEWVRRGRALTALDKTT